MEQTRLRRAAEDDPEGFFKTNPGPLIIDEIQRVPELLSDIQVLADEHKIKGEFILTGSHQPRLAQGISQSLAGRTGILTLLPFSISELESASMVLARDAYLHKGFMPVIHSDGTDPEAFYRAYYQTYVERDVKLLIHVSSQRSFETFMRLLAGRVGQVVNLNSLAGDVGVSATTIGAWLSVLEASFIVFRLPGYYNNFGKRQIKSPKIYFYEVGLAAWLLGIETQNQVSRDPLIGGLFENMVVAEAMKARLNAGKEPGLYYFRDQGGAEVDLLAVHGRAIRPFEIKSGMTCDKSFARHLLSFCKVADTAQHPTVLYGGEQKTIIGDVSFLSFRDTAKEIMEWDATLSAI